MKKLFFYFMIFFTILCLLPQLTWARTGYVSDMLILNFRQAPDNTSTVIQGLKSDTPVFILDEKDEFYKVELESKETGWVEKKYIIFELPKTLIIDQLKQENRELKDKISKLGFIETALKKNESSLPSDQDIENNGNIQNIVKENQINQKKIRELSKELESLKKNNDPLKTDMIKWFLSGVGVLLMGWIVGRSVSSRKQKSKSLRLG